MADPEKKPAEDVEDIEEEEIDAEDCPGLCCLDGGDTPAALLSSPEMLAALQAHLGRKVDQSASFIDSLPKVVKRRIKGLKKLQHEMIKTESKFYEEIHEIECKYAALYTPLYERRRDVVSGTVEPTDSDCDWPSDEEDGDDESKKLADDLQSKVKLENETTGQNDAKEKEEEKPNGIPDFWLTAFKNVDMLADMIQDHDEPILKHLTDLKVILQTKDPVGFTLEFHFDANDYFSDQVLTKQYIMRSEPDPSNPLSYEGPEIIKCKGCTIDWKKGKNVTVKLIKKIQKHKGRGTKRTVTKTVQADSFFNFFSPPEVPEGEEPDEETEALLSSDFEIGHFIKERIVPRAVLYFTGEAVDDDEFEEEEEEEDGEEEDYDEEADPDFNPQMIAGKPGECKQQ